MNRSFSLARVGVACAALMAAKSHGIGIEFTYHDPEVVARGNAGVKRSRGTITPGMAMMAWSASILCALPFCKYATLTPEACVLAQGELVYRGPQVMKGYWNRPDETAIALRDGWLYTGDVARMDEDGYFYIVQRKKDMIIVSGYNVYPNEVEDVLFTHPAVLEAAVIGVPDQYRGEAVKAFLVLKPEMSATAEEILEFCRENLAKYKVPSLIEIVPALPKSAVGKVLRRELREMEAQKEQ